MLLVLETNGSLLQLFSSATEAESHLEAFDIETASMNSAMIPASALLERSLGPSRFFALAVSVSDPMERLTGP